MEGIKLDPRAVIFSFPKTKSTTALENRQQREKEEGETSVSAQELQQAIERVNKILRTEKTSMQIDVDQEALRKVVRVLNSETGETIREIPDRRFIEWEKEFVRLLGLIFDNKI